ncbi:MAG: hypothetical protein HQ543_07725 [Bacteroidetes bacterium]|nr:hypothetical protein [Bacteroidota bacterium]
MNKKKLRILELVWLTVAILCVISGIHSTGNSGLISGMLFFLMALVSFVMYFFRRNMRRKNKDN